MVNIFLACLSDKRDEIKDLRHQLREKEEAFARQNAEIQILKRQLRDQERDFNRARRQSSNPPQIQIIQFESTMTNVGNGLTMSIQELFKITPK